MLRRFYHKTRNHIALIIVQAAENVLNSKIICIGLSKDIILAFKIYCFVKILSLLDSRLVKK